VIFIGLDIGSESRQEIGNTTDLGSAGGMLFRGRALRWDVAERWPGLKELEELRRKFVGHSGRRRDNVCRSYYYPVKVMKTRVCELRSLLCDPVKEYFSMFEC
jgi:hypothetical protein